jgi:hypothetical protein
MSSDWVFNSNSADENIELIYCSAVLESCPPQYVFTIKMKSGQILAFSDSPKFVNLFTANDLLAIKSAGQNLNDLYAKEDKLYFNEDIEGYNLTKNCSFRKPTLVNKVLRALTPCKTIDNPAHTDSVEEIPARNPSMYKRIKNNCSIQ